MPPGSSSSIVLAKGKSKTSYPSPTKMKSLVATKRVDSASAVDDVEIAVAGADGSAPAAITDNAVFDSAPSSSPDGRRIAFERGPAGDDPGNDVWSMSPRWRRRASADDDRRSRRGPGLVPGRLADRVHEHARREQRHLDDGRRRRRSAAADDAARQGGVARLAAAADRGARATRADGPAFAPHPGTQACRSRLRSSPCGSGRDRACERSCAADSGCLRRAHARARSTPGCCSAGPSPSDARRGDCAPQRQRRLTIKLSKRTRRRLAATGRVTLTLKVTAADQGQKPDHAAQPHAHAHGRPELHGDERRAPSGTVAADVRALRPAPPQPRGPRGLLARARRRDRLDARADAGARRRRPRRSTAGSPTGS